METGDPKTTKTPMPQHDILIIRHGETVWNREGRMQGHRDSPLTDKGTAQADALGRMLREAGFLDGRHIRVSPAGRTRATAERILDRAVDAADCDPRLLEIGVGDWEGRTIDVIRADAPHLFTEDIPPFHWMDHAPGGEGFDRIEARCRAFLAELPGPALLVTHGITSRFLRAELLGLGRAGIIDLPGGQGNAFHIRDGQSRELHPGT